MIDPPLYRLLQEELQDRLLNPLFRFVSNAVPAASVSADLQVPIDRALFLQSAVCVASPGAAQNVAEKRISVIGLILATDVRITGSSAADAVGVNGWLAWSGSVIVPGGSIIRATGIFNAGAAINTTRLEIAGILFPRGNIERA